MAICILTKDGKYQEVSLAVLTDKGVYEVSHNLKGKNPIKILPDSKYEKLDPYEFHLVVDWDDFSKLPPEIQKKAFNALLLKLK